MALSYKYIMNGGFRTEFKHQVLLEIIRVVLLLKLFQCSNWLSEVFQQRRGKEM